MNEIISDNQYKCSMCGGIFDKGWSDDAAAAEAEFYFGKHPLDWNNAPAIVCDDCFQTIHPARNQNGGSWDGESDISLTSTNKFR